MGLGLLRGARLRALRPDGCCAARHSVGPGDIERQAAPLRSLHGLRSQGCDAAARELGGRLDRVATVPGRADDVAERKMRALAGIAAALGSDEERRAHPAVQREWDDKRG